jgi:hypothetical protein
VTTSARRRTRAEEAGEETDGKVSGALGSSLLAGEYGLKIVRKVLPSLPILLAPLFLLVS